MSCLFYLSDNCLVDLQVNWVTEFPHSNVFSWCGVASSSPWPKFRPPFPGTPWSDLVTTSEFVWMSLSSLSGSLVPWWWSSAVRTLTTAATPFRNKTWNGTSDTTRLTLLIKLFSTGHVQSPKCRLSFHVFRNERHLPPQSVNWHVLVFTSALSVASVSLCL